MTHDFQADIDAIAGIDAVPTILDVVCRTTGMGFAAVARVTGKRWIACRVLDHINFGLQPGGELKVETTICHEIRESREPVVINHVAEDEAYCGHPTPAMYGFQSYISMPIIRRNGEFFGTLCAIDPAPARLKNPETIGMFKLFAELIAAHLDANEELSETKTALSDERRISELRDQFIAVLGHDLRNPVASINSGANLLLRADLDAKSRQIVALIQGSVVRMRGLIDNVLDFARARLGGGVALDLGAGEPLELMLEQVVAELRSVDPDRRHRGSFQSLRAGRLRSSPDCAAVFQSARQCSYSWSEGYAGQGRGLYRSRSVRTQRLQFWPANTCRCAERPVPAILPRKGQPSGPWARSLHSRRNRQGPWWNACGDIG